MFVGTVASEKITPYIWDKRYNTFDLRVIRKNGDIDVFPIIVEESRDLSDIVYGQKIRFQGYLQSQWTVHEGTVTAVFASHISSAGATVDVATISLVGTVIKVSEMMDVDSYPSISFTAKTRRLPYEPPSLVFVRAYNKLAKSVLDRFHEELNVVIVGRVQMRKFKKNGQDRKSVEIIMTQYEMKKDTTPENA